jgi:transposase-like protein
MIYTTNAIESLHRGLRKIIKTRGHSRQMRQR